MVASVLPRGGRLKIQPTFVSSSFHFILLGFSVLAINTMRYRGNVDDDEDSEMLDMSIVGDEEEQHRIELEHNLRDLSIQLSASNPSNVDEEEQDLAHHTSVRRDHYRSYAGLDSSDELEYPRHDPQPRDVSIFDGQGTSFLEPSQIDYDANYYSYPPGEEDGTHYAADTLSTAAHHASAITLSAGLAGRGGKRTHVRDMSMSGMEYDPDRPLDNVVKGVINDLSMLNVNVSSPKIKKSRKVSYPSLNLACKLLISMTVLPADRPSVV